MLDTRYWGYLLQKFSSSLHASSAFLWVHVKNIWQAPASVNEVVIPEKFLDLSYFPAHFQHIKTKSPRFTPHFQRSIVGFSLVRSRELESLALWLKEPLGLSTLILKLSSLRYFCAKHRDFLPGNFCTLCRILQVRVPIASFETVQKQCRNRALTLGQIKKWWFLIHDLVAIWVTTKVNLIYGKKNAHSSEKFSGEWAFLRRRLI